MGASGGATPTESRRGDPPASGADPKNADKCPLPVDAIKSKPKKGLVVATIHQERVDELILS